MVKNDSFSMFFSSPSTIKKANESLNESFTEKNSLSTASIFRSIQKECDQISSALRFQPPSPSQYQSSLNELINIFERIEELQNTKLQHLVISIFLKVCGNILAAFDKTKYQTTLFRLAQLIAHNIEISLDDIDEKNIKKWKDQIVIESSIHLNFLRFKNNNFDINFISDNIVDDLGLSNGRFHSIRTVIFESAKSITVNQKEQIDYLEYFNSEFLAEEPFLQLVLFKLNVENSSLNVSFLEQLFPHIPICPLAEDIIKSPISIIDIKLFLVSLSVIASTTTESGMTSKNEVRNATQFTLTKIQKDCWKSVVETYKNNRQTAISRLRVSQLIESVRLTNGGSEDVRVLFEAWKQCLQPSVALDEPVINSIKALSEVYREKMNSLLAYGPFYSNDSIGFIKASSDKRRDVKTLFPLQFDYEFVNTGEAEHIGVIINSTEGYIEMKSFDEKDGYENEEEEEDDDNNQSFATASEKYSDSYLSDNSQFFSPMKHNRQSMIPESIGQIIRNETAANISAVSTKSLIMTPSRNENSIIVNRNETGPKLTMEAHLTNSYFPPLKEKIKLETSPIKSEGSYFSGSKVEEFEDEEEEEDNLEAALLDSTRRYEQKVYETFKKSPLKTKKEIFSPKKVNAQTETDSINLSESYSSSELNKSTKSVVENLVLTKEEDDSLLELLMVASTQLIRDHQMQKYQLEKEEVKEENEINLLKNAENKLSKMTSDLNHVIERIKHLSTSTTKNAEFQKSDLSAPAEITTNLDHDKTKCLGCQTDDEQEKALRLLENLANQWDKEGHSDRIPF